jgi:hypothetical protein
VAAIWAALILIGDDVAAIRVRLLAVAAVAWFFAVRAGLLSTLMAEEADCLKSIGAAKKGIARLIPTERGIWTAMLLSPAQVLSRPPAIGKAEEQIEIGWVAAPHCVAVVTWAHQLSVDAALTEGVPAR